MEYLNLISVPAIATAVYLIIEVLKKAFNNNEKFLRIIPLLALFLGAVSGIICYYFIPDILPAGNLVVSAIIGAASGLASTGSNQIVKQLTK
jgi:hypothetical protein